MKRKLALVVLVCLALLCTAFAACNTGVHTHELEKVSAVAATCENAGNIEYYRCKGCKKIFADTNYTDITEEATVVPALGHDVEHHDAQAPSCTQDGWNAYDTCKRDGCNYSTYEKVDALDHDYKEEVTTPATCVAKGVKTITCKRDGCDYTKTEEIEIDENAHDLEQVGAQEASYESVGWEAYEYCKREDCKYTTYEEIAKWAYVDEIKISAENPLFVGNMLVGDEATLTASVLPETAHNKAFVWSTSDENVVTVDEDGNIKAIAVGTATIKATASDGSEVVGEYAITVSAKKSVFDGTNAVLVGCAYNANEGCIGNIGNGSTIKFRINSETAQTVNLQLEVVVNSIPHASYKEHFASITVGGTTVAPADDFIPSGTEYSWSNHGVIAINNVSLIAGENEIIITASQGPSTNVFSLTLFGAEEFTEILPESPISEGNETIWYGKDAERTSGSLGAISVGGDNKLGNINDNKGATLTYKVNSGKATKVGLYLNLAFGPSKVDNIFTLTVNGQTVDIPSSFEGPSGWGTYKEQWLANVDLVQGKNVIVLTVTGGCGNYDYMKLIGDATITEFKEEAPINEGSETIWTGNDAELAGGISAGSDGKIGSIDGNTNAVITYKVNTDKDVKVGLYLSLAFPAKERSDIFELTVNGQKVDIPRTFVATGTTDWNTYEEYWLANVDLKAGQENVIVLHVTGGCGNYGYMKLIGDATITEVEKVVITPITEGNKTTWYGKDAELAGGITIGTDGTLGNINCNNNAVVTYKVNSDKDVKAGLYLSLAFGSQSVSNIFTLTVNNAQVDIPSSFTATGTANWTTYEEYWLANVDLVQGENVIVLKVTGACGNYDYMKLIGDATISAVASEIEVESVKVTTTKELLKVNDTVTLASSVAPSNATDKTLTWSSSDSSVATVDENGNVTAIGEGYADITATAKSGKFATIRIFVSDSEGTKYEAENATLSGCSPESTNGNYVGGWSASASATFTVDGGEGGKVLLRIYTSVVHDDKTDDINKYFTVELNGENVDLSQGTFAYNGETKGWMTNTGFFTIELTLTINDNTIALCGVATTTTCLDCIAIIK